MPGGGWCRIIIQQNIDLRCMGNEKGSAKTAALPEVPNNPQVFCVSVCGPLLCAQKLLKTYCETRGDCKQAKQSLPGQPQLAILCRQVSPDGRPRPILWIKTWWILLMRKWNSPSIILDKYWSKCRVIYRIEKNQDRMFCWMFYWIIYDRKKSGSDILLGILLSNIG